MVTIDKQAEEVFELLRANIFFNAEDACEDLGYPYTMEFCEALDNIGFYCGNCGHWCEVAETSATYEGDEWVCDTCYPEEE